MWYSGELALFYITGVKTRIGSTSGQVQESLKPKAIRYPGDSSVANVAITSNAASNNKHSARRCAVATGRTVGKQDVYHRDDCATNRGCVVHNRRFGRAATVHNVEQQDAAAADHRSIVHVHRDGRAVRSG